MTFYLFSHFIKICMLPPGFNLILGITRLLIWRRWQSVSKILFIISFMSLWLLSTPIVAQYLIDSLQKQYPLLPTSAFSKNEAHKAIVVLGGGNAKAPEYEPNDDISNTTLSRLNYAAYLYHMNQLPVIVSGGSLDKQSATEADLMLNILRNHFHILARWKESKSINTADEGRFLLPILKENKIDVIYLVTNAWHMSRSMYAFKKAFSNAKITIIPAPMGYLDVQREQSVFQLLPSLGSLNASAVAIHEYVGLLWYRLSL